MGTVRRLTLIRHANAEWKDTTFTDFDRPLNPKGLVEAEAIGRLLLDSEPLPDRMLASTARRAQQTAEIISCLMALSGDRVNAEQPLYLARPEIVLAIVQSSGAAVRHLAVVGHNPGISELARALAPAGTELAGLSTACACTLTFNTESWADVPLSAIRAVVYEPMPRSRS